MEYDPYEINNNGEHEYGEWMSCEQASEIQGQLPVGATIVPIILASDKTPVTRQTGSLEMHPTFLTLGNIHSEIWMKATSHAWACIAYIPVPEYVVNSKFSGLLEVRVWHKCMDLVLQNLKVATEVGEFMVDPMGCRHYAFTPLTAHIADLPEQTMIACVLKKCFANNHKRVGTHHFSDGVSHVNQMTGREHRDIQRTLVPTIVGVTSPGFIHAIHALIDFIYKAQAPTFTRSSLDSMLSSLSEFHAHKHFILEVEARTGMSGPINHFQIPKLESFNSFIRSIQQLGAIMQHSADEIVNLINREDVMHQFDLYALLCKRGISLINIMDEDWIAACLLSDEANTAFHVTIAHDLADRSSTALAQHYHLPNFPNVLSQYLDDVSGQNSPYHGCLLKTWYKFRLQLHSQLRPCNIMPSQQVQAYPPSDTSSKFSDFGSIPCTDLALVPCVIQVRMVFTYLPELKEPLLYVELFEIAAPPEAEPHIAMYRVQHHIRIGKIVRLIDVTHAVELVPIYRTTMDHSVSSMTSLERYDNFYLNAFSDKEWYHTATCRFCLASPYCFG
ncbi:hypothetical protein F4604DRAFT_1876637 [Suillus subluteus]|nr:hypothetical protein F4604DRAFT_1876637 [Suillus subluteus]